MSDHAARQRRRREREDERRQAPAAGRHGAPFPGLDAAPPLHLFRSLQQVAGNQTVVSLLQARLEVSSVADGVERGADASGDRLMRLAAPGSLAGILALQRRAGNAVTCRAVRERRRPLLQRVHELPLGAQVGEAKWENAENVAAVRKGVWAAAGGLVVLTEASGRWFVQPGLTHARGGLNPLKDCRPGETYVNAFVIPFHPQHRHELWLMVKFAKISDTIQPGAWGQASGSHGAAGHVPAMSAGEAMWKLVSLGSDTAELQILALNQQTATYAHTSGQGGMARATQYDPVADYQRLIFHGWNEFKNSPYFSSSRQRVETTDPSTLRPGQYMVRTTTISEEQRQKLASRNIVPEDTVITYRPTAEDRSEDAQQRRHAAEEKVMSVTKLDPLQGAVIATWLRISGSNLGAVTKVGFRKGSDRIWVNPDVTSEVTLSVMVPKEAETGVVAVRDRLGKVSESSDAFTVIS